MSKSLNLRRLRRRPSRILSWALVAGGAAVAAAIAMAGVTMAGNAPLKVTSQPVQHRTIARESVRHMANVPAALPGASSRPSQALPYLGRLSPKQFAAAKAAAKTSSAAPKSKTVMKGVQSPALARTAVQTPTPPLRSFNGLADSSTTCSYFGSGCQPSDMAIASSGPYVMQGVNTSFAVYNASGTIQSGWPKTAQAFFGVPNEPGCDAAHGNQPFLSDPRLLYDQTDNRFFAAILQVEGAFGVGGTCPHQSGYWIAVSQTSNPTGAWNVYFLDLGFLTGANNADDFTMIGLTPTSLTIGGDIYDNSGAGFNTGNFILSANKKNLESGGALSVNGFQTITLGGQLLNTIQPVDELSRKVGPTADLFAASLDEHFGGGQCTSGCSGIVLLAIGNPQSLQGSGPVFSGAVISGITYSLPPNAPDGAAADVVDTGDTRISDTPVYQNGGVWGTLNTAFNNGTQVVPAIYWFQAHPVLNHGASSCSLCVSLTGGTMLQNAYFAFSGSNSNYYGSLMPDYEGNMFMVSNYSTASGVHPSVIYESRRTTEVLNSFSDGGQYLQLSTTATADSRWGDYSAASGSGFGNNGIWVAGQYSNGDWATRIGNVGYTILKTN